MKKKPITTDSFEESPNLKQFVKENVSVMFGLDLRIFKTLRQLLFRPGSLTRAFTQGDTQSFTQPTTLYFTINLLFFLVLPIVNSGGIKLFAFSYNGFTKNDGIVQEFILDDLKSSGLSEEVYQAQFDSFIKYNQPALIFIIIPFLILILRLINGNDQNGLLVHTVYAFHFMSFYLITFLLLGTLVNVTGLFIQFLTDKSVISYFFTIPIVLYGVLFFLYLFKSLKLVYGNPVWIGLLKSLVLFTTVIGLMFLYTRFLVALSILSVN